MARSDHALTPALPRRWIVREQRPLNYAVYAARGLLDLDLAGLVAITEAAGVPWSPNADQRWAVIIDENVDDKHGARLAALFGRLGFAYSPLVLSVDEHSKNWGTLERLLDHFKKARLRRRDRIIVIGGGILCDLVGLAAAGYRRGTPYWRIPTSLIAMTDVAAGVKNAVNVGDSKNLYGTYYACELSLVDPSLLSTLPPRHVSNGLVEMIKVALGTNARAFEHLYAHGENLLKYAFQGPADHLAAADTAIVDALGGHIEELRPNLTERLLDRALDLGHICSPAVEMAALPELLHGEAVGPELALACTIASGPRRYLLRESDRDRVFGLLHRLNLPLWHQTMTIDRLEAALANGVLLRDGKQRFPVPGPIGTINFINDLQLDELARALHVQQRLAAQYGPLHR